MTRPAKAVKRWAVYTKHGEPFAFFGVRRHARSMCKGSIAREFGYRVVRVLITPIEAPK